MKTRQAILVIVAVMFLVFLFIPKSDAASEYPSRPITFIIPFQAGGTTDLNLRPLASAAARILKQPVVVQNKAGGSATLGPATLKNMKPDGYNICAAVNNLVNLPLQRDVPFDPLKDFTYICTVTDSVLGIAVKSSSGWKTAKDFIAYAKANPGKIKFAATSGSGTPQHLAMEEISDKLGGIKWELVPYVMGAEAFGALLGGHVQAAWGNILNVTSYLKSGELTLLWILAEERNKLYPNVPTCKELGYHSYSGPVGIIGPARMPKDIVKKLEETFKQALSDPEVVKYFTTNHVDAYYMDSAGYLKWAQDEYASYKDILTKLGLAKK